MTLWENFNGSGLKLQKQFSKLLLFWDIGPKCLGFYIYIYIYICYNVLVVVIEVRSTGWDPATAAKNT